MSADEIRKLADLSTPVMPEHWQATVMWPEQWDKIKAALLSYAAMIERCDKAVESMHTQLMHLANEGKTTVDIGRLSEYFAHFENILRGDAGKEDK